MDYQLERNKAKPKLSQYFENENTLQNIYNLLQVSSSNDDNLRILAEEPEDHLILVHYLVPEKNVFHVRGIIIDVFHMKIVCCSFPYTDEYTSCQLSDIEGNLSDYSVTRTNEGTIIRYFKGRHTNKWYMSIHRKIDGRNSCWSGPTFGEMFDQFWAEPLTFENEEYCYVFLLSHAENRLVCQVDQPTLYYLGAFDQQKYLFNSEFDLKVLSYVKSKAKSDDVIMGKNSIQFDLLDNLEEYIEKNDWTKYTGVLLRKTTFNGYLKCYKFTSEEYLEKREIRGNNPNFRLRYLELREVNRSSEFRQLFPEKNQYFDQIESDLQLIPGFLKDLYHERYIRKQFTVLPKKVHFMLESTYRGYNSSLSIVENIKQNLKHCNPEDLNACIKHMYLVKKKSELPINDDGQST